MISVAPKITEAGKSLQIRALGGETITFTRFKIGNGEISSDTDISKLTNLVNELIEFPIAEIDKSMEGYIKLTGTFDNAAIDTDFRWRELGIFCKGEDDNEVLYAYSNDGENAGLLKANTSDVVVEQTVSLIIAIGEAENVTAILSHSLLYASKEEFDKHIAAENNPHNLDKKAVGLGNVPNVSTNDQTPTYVFPSDFKPLSSGEKLSIAFGKIAKAVKTLIDHLGDKNNPHKLTAESISAADEEHEHSAADITSGVLGVARGGTGVVSYPSLRNKLGFGNDTGVLREQYGGTGRAVLEGTDYSTSRVRGISLYSGTPTSVKNGCIVGVYSD